MYNLCSNLTSKLFSPIGKIDHSFNWGFPPQKLLKLWLYDTPVLQDLVYWLVVFFREEVFMTISFALFVLWCIPTLTDLRILFPCFLVWNLWTQSGLIFFFSYYFCPLLSFVVCDKDETSKGPCITPKICLLTCRKLQALTQNSKSGEYCDTS